MLTLQQYLDQFVRKDFTIELRRLITEVGLSRQRIWMIANGSSASIDTALAIYRVTDGRVDPRTLATKFDWKAMDAYYAGELGMAAPTPSPADARRATRKAAAKKAAKKAATPIARKKAGKK